MADEQNEQKGVQKNSMYIEVEDDEEILRLQQEIIKSNLPIEDVAKVVGKLQKLLELTKHNTNENYSFKLDKNPIWDWTYKPYLDSQPLFNQPITLTNTSTSSGALGQTLYGGQGAEDVSTGVTVSSTLSAPIRKDVPF